MKVLMINGSPREKGCTFTALKEVQKALDMDGVESEIVWLGTKAISGCIACNQCSKLGHCVFDDKVNEVNSRADEFDALIVGGPVYYGGICAQLTAFLDRLFYSASGKWHHKLGAAITSCRRAGSTASLQRLNQYFLIGNMHIVGSQYWNMVHGNTLEQVMQDEEGLQIMRTLGHNMAWMLKNVEAGKEKGITLPEKEPRKQTNFIR